jgi:hypothetical protein
VGRMHPKPLRYMLARSNVSSQQLVPRPSRTGGQVPRWQPARADRPPMDVIAAPPLSPTLPRSSSPPSSASRQVLPGQPEQLLICGHSRSSGTQPIASIGGSASGCQGLFELCGSHGYPAGRAAGTGCLCIGALRATVLICRDPCLRALDAAIGGFAAGRCPRRGKAFYGRHRQSLQRALLLASGSLKVTTSPMALRRPR